MLPEILRGCIVCLNRELATPDFCGDVISSIFSRFSLYDYPFVIPCFKESQARMNVFLNSHFCRKITTVMRVICQKYRVLRHIKAPLLRNYLRGCIACPEGDLATPGCCEDAIFPRFCHVLPGQTSQFNPLFLGIGGQNEHIF